MAPINIVIPTIGVHVILVNRSDPVSSLLRFFPNQKVEFVFRRQVLNPQQTLDFYNLRRGDALVLIWPTMRSGFAKDRWIRATQGDEFEASVKFATAKECRHEFSRLRDLHLLRIQEG
jgi:hypothetical protein